MNILSLLISNLFGIFTESISAAIFCALALTVSTTTGFFQGTSKNTCVQKPAISCDQEKSFPNTYVTLEGNLLPEITVIFTMGKNGKIFVISN